MIDEVQSSNLCSLSDWLITQFHTVQKNVRISNFACEEHVMGC